MNIAICLHCLQLLQMKKCFFTYTIRYERTKQAKENETDQQYEQCTTEHGKVPLSHDTNASTAATVNN